MEDSKMSEVLYDYYRKENTEMTRDFFGEQDINIPHGTTGNQPGYDWRHSEFTLAGSTMAYVANIKNLNSSYFEPDSTFEGFYNTTLSAGSMIIDAEKTYLQVKDTNMCWAATDSNLMFQTGWITTSVESEDELFNLYRQSFVYGETRQGYPYYGADWYLTGNYNPPFEEALSSGVLIDECMPGTGGYFANTVTNVRRYVNPSLDSSFPYDVLANAITDLKNGNAVGLRIAQCKWGVPDKGHIITLQGYTYELVNGGSTEKVTGVIIADSDNDMDTAGGSSYAPNVLTVIPIHYIMGDIYLDWNYGNNMMEGWSPWKMTHTTTVTPAAYTVLSSGGAIVHQGATVLRENIGNQETLNVYENGLAKSNTILNGGVQTVFAGGVASRTFVNPGGKLVFSGGTGEGPTTVSAGGKVTVASPMTFGNGATVSAENGGIFDFDISNLVPANAALVNNLSVVQGTPVYTLTVSQNTVSGLYRLADGASNFEESITVKNANGTTMGTLNVSVMERIGGVSYLLDETNGHLAVSVIDTPMKAPEFFNGSFSGGDAIFAAQSGNTVYFYTDETGWDTPLSLGTGWEALGAGDFDGGGATDVLRINSDGYVVGEMSEGDGTFSQEVLNALGTGWSIVGIGDFNHNGHDDVLVANPTAASESVGLIGYWEGGTTWNVIDGYLSGDWWVVGTGDFNGDGKCDILWKGSEMGTGGQVSDSYHAMFVGIDPNAQNWIEFEETSPALQYLCTGDFNGDGTTDVALIDGSGEVNVWGITGGERSSSSVLNSNEGIDTSVWTFAGVGDFNGDGTDDIAWCNRITGQVSCWEIEEMEIADTQTLAYLA